MTGLPPELAPALRARAEALMSEVRVLEQGRRHSDQPQQRKLCWSCRKPGPLVFHHRVHGDDSTLVEVHSSCHRRLHQRKGKGKA